FKDSAQKTVFLVKADSADYVPEEFHEETLLFQVKPASTDKNGKSVPAVAEPRKWKSSVMPPGVKFQSDKHKITIYESRDGLDPEIVISGLNGLEFTISLKRPRGSLNDLKDPTPSPDFDVAKLIENAPEAEYTLLNDSGELDAFYQWTSN